MWATLFDYILLRHLNHLRRPKVMIRPEQGGVGSLLPMQMGHDALRQGVLAW
jgi:hypothetical protein